MSSSDPILNRSIYNLESSVSAMNVSGEIRAEERADRTSACTKMLSRKEPKKSELNPISPTTPYELS